MFSCEICENFKNTCFEVHQQTTAFWGYFYSIKFSLGTSKIKFWKNRFKFVFQRFKQWLHKPLFYTIPHDNIWSKSMWETIMLRYCLMAPCLHQGWLFKKKIYASQRIVKTNFILHKFNLSLCSVMLSTSNHSIIEIKRKAKEIAKRISAN